VWCSQPRKRSITGDSDHVAIVAGLPPIAVPITVNIPDPITMPMPSAVSDTGPSVLRNACSGSSESPISLSIDLVANSWDLVAKICLGSVETPAREVWDTAGEANSRRK
jgi:hypothetical protein